MLIRIVSVLVGVCSLAACAPVFNGVEQSMTFQERHPISVDAQTMTMEITAEPGAFALSAVDKARVRAFAGVYQEKGHGPLTLTFPSGSQNVKISVAYAAEVRQTLRDAGIPWSLIEGASYRAPGDSDQSTMFLSFTRYVASTAPCGDWSGDLAKSPRNTPWANFGCATQQNFAAMIADPRDLVEPTPTTPADAQRRAVVLEKYGAGEVTSSEFDEQSSITLNEAVQGQ
ncbi:MAG: CpaD family pilus assembly protein [Pseudomonadota bacterium]